MTKTSDIIKAVSEINPKRLQLFYTVNLLLLKSDIKILRNRVTAMHACRKT